MLCAKIVYINRTIKYDQCIVNYSVALSLCCRFKVIAVWCSFSGGWWSGIPTLSYDKYDTLCFYFFISVYLYFLICVAFWESCMHSVHDRQFLSKVAEKFSKDTDLIVTCQKGLRWDFLSVDRIPNIRHTFEVWLFKLLKI